MSVAALDRWADILIESHTDAPVGANLVRLVRPDPSSSDVELGLLPLGGGHPADFLEGFRAPASWMAIGVATGGWAAPMDGTSIAPSAHPEAQRVYQVILVDRDGTVVSRVRYPDGTIMTEPPAFGAVLDALRAALRLRPARASRTRRA